MQKSGTHRARTILEVVGRAYPAAWRMMESFRAARGQDLPLWPILSCLLYLCADDAEIDGNGRPGNPTPVRTRRHGVRMFPADGPKAWDVGVRIGAALRSAGLHANGPEGANPGTAGRSSPRPHIRRAHWHTFLAGQGRCERRIRWLPPIPVNVANTDYLPTVIRPV